jgi:hypothetical protein
MPEPDGGAQDKKAIERAFGAENRNRLIDLYFQSTAEAGITPANAWAHVYRLLLWLDPTTGLAHCYESDKSQPGKAWYARSLAFHDWLANALGVAPVALAEVIDRLFIRACSDLAGVMLRREARLAEAATRQREPYAGRGFPEPGTDPELVSIIRHGINPYLGSEPPEGTWHALAQRVRSYLAVQNKRKNLVGEGFEDVLAQVVRRACTLPDHQIFTRCLLYDIPGFNRAKVGNKENKVDLAIIRPSMRTLVTAKWSVRADREKQFPTEYAEYISAQSENRKFEYVFVTNEFDPARLMRACENLHNNNPMFDSVVHINTDAIKACYAGAAGGDADGTKSQRRVLKHIEDGRLISLERWFERLLSQ